MQIRKCSNPCFNMNFGTPPNKRPIEIRVNKGSFFARFEAFWATNHETIINCLQINYNLTCFDVVVSWVIWINFVTVESRTAFVF